MPEEENLGDAMESAVERAIAEAKSANRFSGTRFRGKTGRNRQKKNKIKAKTDEGRRFPPFPYQIQENFCG